MMNWAFRSCLVVAGWLGMELIRDNWKMADAI